MGDKMDNRKVVLIGTGFVGMSMAYSLMNTGGIDELVLVDLDFEKARGEAMDMNHGLPYGQHKMKIKAGTYKDCDDADIIVIGAGANQKPGESRLDLTMTNSKIIKSICLEIKKTSFDGIVIIASNPVDTLSYIVYKTLGINYNRVIGTGTLLDTARMKYILSEYLKISSDNVEAYIMGEHGDSSFISWQNTFIGCKTILEYIDEKKLDMNDLNEIYDEVKNAAYEIIERKKATYYGIGASLNMLIQTIFNDENKILCCSVYLDNVYGVSDIFMGVPCIINRNGVREVVELNLNESDKLKFSKSYKILKESKLEIKELINEEIN